MIHLFEVQVSVSVGIYVCACTCTCTRGNVQGQYSSQWLVLRLYPVLVPVSPVKFQQI